MGQKVSPNGLRLGINKYWQSRWFATKDYARFLNEDIKIRSVLEDQLSNSGTARIEIERTADEIKVDVFTSKPGVVIGKRGTNINDIREIIQNEVSK
ncbi:MAG: 30S ribosomal protein S3, partial [Actinobacteria bacterium]|nr:30S ribosomal protein S3 [Actinomycetota bacterium]